MEKKKVESRRQQPQDSYVRADKISLADFVLGTQPTPPPRTPSVPISADARHPKSSEENNSEGEIQTGDPENLAPPVPQTLAAPQQHVMLPSKRYSRSLSPWEIDLSKLILSNVIGRGAFGCVYKGIYENQEVAVKILDWGEEATMSRSELDSVKRSYIQEATVWHKLSHPNITKFVGAHVGDTRIKTLGYGRDSIGNVYVASSIGCIVEEYVCGGSLRKYLTEKAREKISYPLVIRFARDLAKGLDYLHSQTVVHRDLKPDNILLDNYMNLKIADFGVSRIEAANPRDMTGETGTLHYMAPEVIEGKPYNRSCDVYSFGVCLWEIYCCEPPYRGMGINKYMSDVVIKKVRPPIPKCCPQDLAKIITQCWDADPEKRPNMSDVSSTLQKIDTSSGAQMQRSQSKLRGLFCLA